LIDREKIYDQCLSEDPEERLEALEQLEASFSLLPDREQAWNYLHRLTNDEDIGVKCAAISFIQLLKSTFKESQSSEMKIQSSEMVIPYSKKKMNIQKRKIQRSEKKSKF
jgi:HEAT repeat protein